MEETEERKYEVRRRVILSWRWKHCVNERVIIVGRRKIWKSKDARQTVRWDVGERGNTDEKY